MGSDTKTVCHQLIFTLNHLLTKYINAMMYDSKVLLSLMEPISTGYQMGNAIATTVC